MFGNSRRRKPIGLECNQGSARRKVKTYGMLGRLAALGNGDGERADTRVFRKAKIKTRPYLTEPTSLEMFSQLLGPRLGRQITIRGRHQM